jgi:hypothetical protein
MTTRLCAFPLALALSLVSIRVASATPIRYEATGPVSFVDSWVSGFANWAAILPIGTPVKIDFTYDPDVPPSLDCNGFGSPGGIFQAFSNVSLQIVGVTHTSPIGFLEVNAGAGNCGNIDTNLQAFPAFVPFSPLATLFQVQGTFVNHLDPTASDPPATADGKISLFGSGLGPGEAFRADLISHPVPEPATFALLGAGLAVLAACRRRASHKKRN